MSAVENVVREAFFQQFDQVLGRSAAHEAGLHSRLLHHLLEIADKRQRNSARTRLEREAIMHDARIAQETRYKLGDAQAIWRARNLRCARDDFRRIADGVDLNHIIHVVSLNLPRDAREGNQVVRDDDDVVRVDRICQRETQKTAGGLALGAIAVAERVGWGSLGPAE